MGNKKEQGFTDIFFILLFNSYKTHCLIFLGLVLLTRKRQLLPNESIEFLEARCYLVLIKQDTDGKICQENFHCGDGSPFTSRSFQSISWFLCAMAKKGLVPAAGQVLLQWRAWFAVPPCLGSPWSKGTSVWPNAQRAGHPQPPQLTCLKSAAAASACVSWQPPTAAWAAAVRSQDRTSWSSLIWWTPKGHVRITEQIAMRHASPSTAGAEGQQISFLPCWGFEGSSKIGGQHSGRIDITVLDPFGPMLGSRAMKSQVGSQTGSSVLSVGALGRGRSRGAADLTVSCIGALTNPPHLKNDGTAHGGRFILLQFSFWIQQGLTLWKQS